MGRSIFTKYSNYSYLLTFLSGDLFGEDLAEEAGVAGELRASCCVGRETKLPNWFGPLPRNCGAAEHPPPSLDTAEASILGEPELEV